MGYKQNYPQKEKVQLNAKITDTGHNFLILHSTWLQGRGLTASEKCFWGRIRYKEMRYCREGKEGNNTSPPSNLVQCNPEETAHTGDCPLDRSSVDLAFNNLACVEAASETSFCLTWLKALMVLEALFGNSWKGVMSARSRTRKLQALILPQTPS